MSKEDDFKVLIHYEKESFSSPEEEVAASILTEGQKQALRNLLSEAAQEKLWMSVEEEGYPLKQERLRGQMDIIVTLLAKSDAAQNLLLNPEVE